MSDSVTIAVDAAGGAGAPQCVVDAVAELSRGRDGRVYYVLVGDDDRISDLLVRTRHNPERITVVAGEDDPIGRASELVADGVADALVSAGRATEIVAHASAALRRLPGVGQPALASVYPTWDADGGEHFNLMLDVGAAYRASADDLVQFAIMGAAYAQIVSNIERPRVALLSVSSDPESGTAEVAEASRRLSEFEGLQYAGTIEGRRVARSGIDVIVCEGVVGDVTLKVMEGFAEAAFELAENAYERKFAYRMGLRLLSPGLRKIRKAVDFEQYGGAPLLGYDKVIIVADPTSDAGSIQNAIKLATKNVRQRLTELIAAGMQ